MMTCCQLSKSYPAFDKGRKTIGVVKDITFTLEVNQSYALVGESGSGKSTLARLLCGIEKPDSGQVLWNGLNLSALSAIEMRPLRKDIQLVLQDSVSTLDPRMRIEKTIAEPLECLFSEEKGTIKRMVMQMAERVGLSENQLHRFPHELSGGQLKRVSLARALIVSPKLIVFDESTSGLDVTIRKQILDLLLDIKQREECTFLFITHDLDVALYMANHVFVMKDGQIVERVQDVSGFDSFQHEYSRLLISSLPMATV